MTSGESERDEPYPPDGAEDGLGLPIGWHKDGEAASPATGPEHGAELPTRAVAAEPASALDDPASDGGVEAPSGSPAEGAEAIAALAAGQQRILAMLEDMTSQHAVTVDGEGPVDLGETARSIAAATAWANDIRAAMDSLLVATGALIRDLKDGEQGLGNGVAALKAREDAFDRQIELFAGGARALDTRLEQLDAARQMLDARSAELQAVKQEIAKYYGEWTGGALTYRREMAALSKRLGEGENLVTRVEKAIGPWTARIEESLDENAEAQMKAAAETSGNVRRLTEAGDTFLEMFGEAWEGALEDFRTEWRRTRRWSVPVLAAAMVLAIPGAAVVGALGQSQFAIFTPDDDLGGWRQGFWLRHGDQVRACATEAIQTNKTVPCRFDVSVP